MGVQDPRDDGPFIGTESLRKSLENGYVNDARAVLGDRTEESDDSSLYSQPIYFSSPVFRLKGAADYYSKCWFLFCFRDDPTESGRRCGKRPRLRRLSACPQRLGPLSVDWVCGAAGSHRPDTLHKHPTFLPSAHCFARHELPHPLVQLS